MKTKRVLAMLLAVLMVLTISIPQNVSAASPDARYTGTGQIKDLLTEYQYVVRGDAGIYCHCVGSVAVGGTMDCNNYIGDCSQSPSYANVYKSGGITGVNNFLGSTRDFYYGTSSVSEELMTQNGFTQNGEYMDLDSMFVSLIKQSDNLYKTNVGTQATVQDMLDKDNNPKKIIQLDFSTNTVFTITKDDFIAADTIEFIHFDVADLSTNEYLINIVGVGDTDLRLDGEYGGGAATTPTTNFFIDKYPANTFLKDLPNALNGIQCNLSGMKLIWNFPDATGNIQWNGMGGHLVAPQAYVNVTSGRFEGGIIADAVTSSGQAHYFPYNAYGVSEDGTEIVANDIVIKKEYLLLITDTVTGKTTTQKVNPTESAKFTLYTDAACTSPVTGAIDVPVDNATGYATFDSRALGLTLGESYYVKETVAPDGFEIDKKTVYECAISVGGLVTYKEVNGGTAYTSTVPEYQNLMTTYTDDSSNGTLKINVVDIDNNNAKVKDADIKIEFINPDSSTTLVANLTTDESGSVTKTDLPQGTYQVTITDIPEGYIYPEEKVVEVNVRETGYYTFELEQEKETITVYIKDTNDNIVPGGYVQITDKNDPSDSQKYHVGTDGMIAFPDKVKGTYVIELLEVPEGYNMPNVVTQEAEVVFTDAVDNYVREFIVDRQDGTVIVNIKDVSDSANVDSYKTTVGGTVTITYPDGKTTVIKADADDGALDGVVTFTNVPVGECEVKVSTAPASYILVANPTDADKVSSKEVKVIENTNNEFNVYVERIVKTGALTITVVTQDGNCTETDENKVAIRVIGPDGNTTPYSVVYIDNTVVNFDDATTTLQVNDAPVGTYTIEIETPDGWKTIKAEVVDVTTDTATPGSIDAAVTEGAETKVKFTVDAIGNLEVTVVDEATDAPVSGATVVIKKGDQKIDEVTTGNDGKVTVNNLPTGDYTVEVSKVPEGKDYVVPTSPIIVNVPKNDTGRQTIELTQTGTLEIQVREKDTPNPIAGATVYLVKDGESVSDAIRDAEVDSTGNVTFTGIAPGEYDVVIDADAIADTWDLVGADTQGKTIASGANDPAVLFELTKQTGTLTVEIVKKVGDVFVPVTGAEIKINVKDEKGNPVSLVDNSFEFVNTVTNTLPVGDYKVTLEQVPGNYVLPSTTTQDADVTVSGDTIIFEVKEVDNAQNNLGNLRVNVYLKDETPENLSNNPVFTNSVEIKYVPLSGASTTETFNNLDALKLNKTDLPAGNYTTVLTIPAGYTLVAGMADNTATQTKAVVAGETTVINYVLEAAGTINVTVTNKAGDEMITGADVVLKDSNGVVVGEGTTDSNGKVTFDKVPVGNYTVEIKSVPDGYDMPDNKVYDVTVDSHNPVNKEYKLPLSGKVVITVYEYGTDDDVITGATVTLKDSEDNVIGGSQTTNVSGKVYYEDLKDGTYTAEITAPPAPNGDKKYAIVSETIKPNKLNVELKAGSREESADFYVDALGNLEATIVEDGTTTPIPGAQVQITDSKGNIIKDGGTDYFVTNANGMISKTDLPVGAYTLKVTYVPDPYKMPKNGDSATVTVVKHDTVEKEFVAAYTTSLTITVKDEESNNVLSNETNGKTTLEVTDQYGETVVKTTTDGKVTLDDWAVSTPGKPTTVTITKVPSSHIVPTEENKKTTTVEVEKPVSVGDVTEHEVKVPTKPNTTGDLIITVKDEVLNTNVPNAYVEITYPDGSKELAYTDSNGTINKPGVTTGNYTVVIKGVPQGYTPPSQTVSKITVTTGKNKLDIVIKTPVITGGANSNNTSKSNKTSDETVVKAPKTGDISYMPFAIAMMVISLIGLAGVTVYRRKMENEE
ncbi:MAG: carboxypeptidase regulatory-like domain-containing protein [Lachnospiraceae bacterium]|nr:carboxypeptidase regulatory-like domain-containing protein [Lachnospiraceae bacterium]